MPAASRRFRSRLAGLLSTAALAASPLALADPAPPATTPAGPSWSDLRHEGQKMNADIGKIVSPNGIDEAGYMMVGGVRQWVTVRGQDKSLPILLYLHGGPGGALADESYLFQRPWEDYFTVVQWDQRGFGRSGVDADKLKGTITNDQYVSDAIDLIEQLKVRLHQPKIIVLGQSWGSALGLQVAHRRPDLLYALVTVGMVTAWDENFEETRQLLIDLAKKTGDAVLLKKMTDLGAEPADNTKAVEWIGAVQAEMENRGYSWHNSQGPWGGRIVTALKFSPSVSDADLVARMHPNPDTPAYSTQVVNSLRGWTAEKVIGTRLEVPLIALQGDWDWQTPTPLATAYFGKVCAPWKVWVPFHNSAHVVVGEEPGKAIVTLVTEVLPAATGKAPADAVYCKP